MNVSDFLENYNRVEEESFRSYPNFLLRAFSPVTFHNLGFQTQIKSEGELWKYIDTQHEGRYFDNLSLLNGGFTADEFEIFQEAVDICINFTTSIHKGLVPINSLTRSLISFRAIKSYYTSLNEEPSVLEIGSGSGYLGLLCGISGWQYSSLDVTKSLITYQNALWNFAGFKVKFAEIGVTYPDSDFLQIPWWVWAEAKNTLPKRKIVVANHVIQEMTPLSLSFTMKKSLNLGAEYAMAEGLGYGTYKNNLSIVNRNTDLIHNVSTRSNYQKVWVWKIKNNQHKVTDFFESANAFPNSNKGKILLIKAIEKYKFSNLLRIKLNNLRRKRANAKKNKQITAESLIHPKITVGIDVINSYIRSKGVSFITMDEETMRWANHNSHI